MGFWEVAAGVAVALGRFKLDIHDKANKLALFRDRDARDAVTLHMFQDREQVVTTCRRADPAELRCAILRIFRVKPRLSSASHPKHSPKGEINRRNSPGNRKFETKE
jgi:hypothetical protein